MGYRVLSVTKEIQAKVRTDVKAEFLRIHPEMKGANITDNMLVAQMAEYYLER
jgi:hypothetical protein